MKRKLIIGLLLCSIVAGIVMINQPVKAKEESTSEIGYVDMQKLFINHPDKAAAEAKLNQKAKKLQKKLETEAKNMTKEERQKLLEKYQKQLNEVERGLVGEVMEDINVKIRQVAKEKGITVVVDKPTVIYGGYDLTADVIKVIDTIEKEDQNTDSE